MARSHRRHYKGIPISDANDCKTGFQVTCLLFLAWESNLLKTGLHGQFTRGREKNKKRRASDEAIRLEERERQPWKDICSMEPVLYPPVTKEGGNSRRPKLKAIVEGRLRHMSSRLTALDVLTILPRTLRKTWALSNVGKSLE